MPDLVFSAVPDDKVVKNRLHLDLRPSDQVAEVERLIGLGAARVDIGQSSDVHLGRARGPRGQRVLRPASLHATKSWRRSLAS